MSKEPIENYLKALNVRNSSTGKPAKKIGNGEYLVKLAEGVRVFGTTEAVLERLRLAFPDAKFTWDGDQAEA